MSKDSIELKYLNTCACVDAMDRIASKTFLRLSYEYGICFLKRELIPTMASICLKSLISNLGSLRDDGEISSHINLYDLVTLGLVELNFDETEKATNILPDFRIGKRGCEYSKMDFEEYNKRQVSLENYNGKVIDIKSGDLTNNLWSGLVQQMNDAIYLNSNFIIQDRRLTNAFLEIFLEEMFYDLGNHKGEKDYVYKLFDILYFNYNDKDDMWGTDVMPEYKLMVKNDAYLEDNVISYINDYNKEKEESSERQGLYYDKY